MNSKFVRGGVALGATALALTGFTACTDDDDGGGGGGGGKRGAKAPREEPVDVTPAAAVEKAVEKSEDITSLTYRMSVTVPKEGKIEGRGGMSMDPIAMQMTMEMKGATPAESGEVEIRIVDGDMYMNAGQETAADTGGKSWMKFDFSELQKDGKDPLADMGSGLNDNPAEESGMMTAADDLKKIGPEKIDGVRTTHYAGTVTLDDLRKSLKGEDAETRERREEKLKEFEKLGVDELKMDMWIDGNDLTKQFQMRSETTEGPMDTKMTVLDINKPVTVEAPPAAETMDLSEMSGS